MKRQRRWGVLMSGAALERGWLVSQSWELREDLGISVVDQFSELSCVCDMWNTEIHVRWQQLDRWTRLPASAADESVGW